jgi:hypothetical protein
MSAVSESASSCPRLQIYDWLLRESGELRAIFGKSLGTARANSGILKS